MIKLGYLSCILFMKCIKERKILRKCFHVLLSYEKSQRKLYINKSFKNLYFFVYSLYR